MRRALFARTCLNDSTTRSVNGFNSVVTAPHSPSTSAVAFRPLSDSLLTCQHPPSNRFFSSYAAMKPWERRLGRRKQSARKQQAAETPERIPSGQLEQVNSHPHQQQQHKTFPLNPRASPFTSSENSYTLPSTTYVPPAGHSPGLPLIPARHIATSPVRVPPPVAPVPTSVYLEQTALDPIPTTSPNPLLVILDLNGTLICRKRRGFPPVFTKRPGLDAFLDYLFANFKVMLWSSSQPKTVTQVLDSLFLSRTSEKLVATWARDTLDLTKRQYREKVQVYKRLNKVWDDEQIQASYPAAPKGNAYQAGQGKDPQHKWDQTNTILIDDSILKAASQPHNIIEIPEFTNDPEEDEEKNMHTVMRQLRILSYQDDVSRKLRSWADHRRGGAAAVNPDAVDEFWDGELRTDEHALEASLGQKLSEFMLGALRPAPSGNDRRPAGDVDEVEGAIADTEQLMGQKFRISEKKQKKGIKRKPKPHSTRKNK